MNEKIIIIDISIWEMNMDNPENKDKYRLAISTHNGMAVSFGPYCHTKKEALKMLSLYRKSEIFGYDESYALMHMIADKLKRK